MTNKNEIWLPVVGYEGLYEVSDLGRIKSLDKVINYSNGRKEFMAGRLRSIVVNKRNGYCYIGLTKDKVQKIHRLHRIVAKAHIENPLMLPEVNHEDFDKQNNKKSNLVWCDRFYQNQHASKKEGRRWQNHRLGKTGKHNPASKPVVVFDLNGNKVGNYESGMLAAKATNSNQANISKCCTGVSLTHNNLKFQFE